MDQQKPARQRQAFRRFHRTAAEKTQPVAVDFDHAPAGAAQARIDAEDTDGMANRRMGHGAFYTPCRSLKPSAGAPLSTVIPSENGWPRAPDAAQHLFGDALHRV